MTRIVVDLCHFEALLPPPIHCYSAQSGDKKVRGAFSEATTTMICDLPETVLCRLFVVDLTQVCLGEINEPCLILFTRLRFCNTGEFAPNFPPLLSFLFYCCALGDCGRNWCERGNLWG